MANDHLLDEAYELHGQWGPSLSTPRKALLMSRYPALHETEIDQMLLLLAAVNATVSRLAVQGGDTKLGRAHVVEIRQSEHPFFRGPGLNSAHFLVNYGAWHDGYG